MWCLLESSARQFQAVDSSSRHNATGASFWVRVAGPFLQHQFVGRQHEYEKAARGQSSSAPLQLLVLQHAPAVLKHMSMTVKDIRVWQIPIRGGGQVSDPTFLHKLPNKHLGYPRQQHAKFVAGFLPSYSLNQLPAISLWSALQAWRRKECLSVHAHPAVPGLPVAYASYSARSGDRPHIDSADPLSSF